MQIEELASLVAGKIRYHTKKELLISPTTQKEWGKISYARPEDIEMAIDYVKKMPKIEYNPYERAEILHEIARDLQERKEEFAECITLEMGKPIADARGEITYASNYFKWYGEEIKRVYGKIIPSSKPNKKLELRYEPIGPCVIVTPWNFPIAMAARKMAPAFAAGCPVIAKPSSVTPASMLMLATLCLEAGVPPNAFQVLIGQGKEIVPPLMESPHIRKLSFTGSSEIGKELYAQGASTTKKCTLEMGGHAPFIIFDDANLEAAVEGAILAKFRMSGQTCICANRIFVHRSIHEPFIKLFSEKVKKMPIGDPLIEETELSTILHPDSIKKVKAHIEDALKKGAKSLLNAKEPYEPEILTNVTPDMLIFNEETFGPVAPIISFDTEEEVIELANQTPYGLASYIYTEGLKRSERVTNALQFGIVGLNDPLPSAPEASFGGIKGSGFGREGGPTGIYEYLSEKFISQKL